MKTIKFGDTSAKAELGDKVELQGQTQDVVKCQVSDVNMINVDANQLKKGDLKFIKKLGLTISNPETSDPIALGVKVPGKKTFGEKLAEFFTPSEDDSSEDDHDDSSFFGGTGFSGSDESSESSGSSFGGFGGFGGGSFGGAGASASF
jgi:uncharacterized membrane protein YgcG